MVMRKRERRKREKINKKFLFNNKQIVNLIMLRLSCKFVVNLIALCAFKLMVLISLECFMDLMSHKSVFKLMINFEV